MSKKITTLFEDAEHNNELYPRTKTQAITDSSNNSLDTILSNKQDKVSNSTDKLASFNSSGQTENSTIDKSDVSDIIDDYKNIEELKSNQEFLYRQTPVAYDGTGTLTSIKGNTVSFNQLVHGEFGANYTTYWNVYSGTGSVSNGVLTVSNAVGRNGVKLQNAYAMPLIVGHKYYVSLYYTSTVELEVHAVKRDIFLPATNSLTKYSGVFECTAIGQGQPIYDIFPKTSAEVGTFTLKYPQCMDLTLMGIDNLTTTAQVEAWLSSHIGDLPYYDYTQGTLIPFMGSGLKTTGKNLVSNEVSMWESGIFNGGTGEPIINNQRIRYNHFVSVIVNTQYTFTMEATREIIIYRYNTDGTYLGYYPNSWSNPVSYTPTHNEFIKIGMRKNGNEEIDPSFIQGASFQMEIGNATPYEPYTSNTLSLPTLTYFPSGMKRTGSVYDELSDKAYTRIGSVDLGSLTWSYNDVSGQFYVRYSDFTNMAKVNDNSQIANILCSKYITMARNDLSNYGICQTFVGHIIVYDNNFTNDYIAFKTAMSGQYLYYELATPTETDISLDLTYPVWNGGTEQIYPTPLMNWQVDMGTLEWGYVPSQLRFYALLPSVKSGTQNIFCSKYPYGGYKSDSQMATADDKTIYNQTSSEYIKVKDTSFTDATTFKQAMSGVMLYYETTSSIPTTTSIKADINYRNRNKVRYDNVDKIPDKQDILISGTNIKTIGNQSLLGSGNVALDSSAVGLGSVVNTGDSDTPSLGGTDKFTTGGAYALDNTLKAYADNKPTILYGTSVPSASTGKNGDIFILYS